MEVTQQVNEEKIEKKKRTHVTSACLNCKKLHVSCNKERPCARCVERNKECVEGESKRRGRKRQNSEEPVAGSPLPMAPNLIPHSPPASVLQQIVASTFPQPNYFVPPPPEAELLVTQGIPSEPLLGDMFLFAPFENMESVVSTRLYADSPYGLQQRNETPSTFTRPGFIAKITERLRRRIPEKLHLLETLKPLRIQLETIREGLKPEAVGEIMRSFDLYLTTFGNLFDQLGLPSIMWERTGIIHYVNRAYIELTGFRQFLPTPLDDFAFSELLSDEGLGAYIDNVCQIFLTSSRAVAQTDTFTFRTSLKTGDGLGWIPGMMCVSVKRDFLGLPLLFVGNFIPCSNSR